MLQGISRVVNNTNLCIVNNFALATFNYRNDCIDRVMHSQQIIFKIQNSKEFFFEFLNYITNRNNFFSKIRNSLIISMFLVLTMFPSNAFAKAVVLKLFTRQRKPSIRYIQRTPTQTSCKVKKMLRMLRTFTLPSLYCIDRRVLQGQCHVI